MSGEPTPTILVVDDSERVRDVTGEILRMAGFHVLEAATGAEGLRLAAERPALVVLDISLPDLDGFEVCRRLKAAAATAAIPVLHLSGVFRGVENKIRGLDTGADGYLTQPVDAAELIATVKALLRLRRAEADLRESEARRHAAEALADVARVLAQSLDPEEVAQRIADSVRTLLAAEAAILYVLDPESGGSRPLAVSGDMGPDFSREEMLAPGTGLVGLAVREGGPVTTPNVLEDPRISFTPDVRARIERASYRAGLAVPLVVKGGTIGAFWIGGRSGRLFEDAEARLAQAFADQAALALENARLYAEVRDARDFLRSIAENSPDAIVTTDPRGRITYVSPGAEEVLGYRPDELLGRPVAELYWRGLEEARAVMRWLGEVRRSRHYETAIRVKDGRRVECSASLALLCDAAGAVLGTLGIVRDITRRKQAEQALTAKENLLRAIIDTEPESVKLLGRGGIVLDANRAGLAMIGADSLEDVLGKPVVRFVAPEHRAAFTALIEGVLLGVPGQLGFELVGLKGSHRWLETHAVPFRNETNEIVAALTITRDVTERRQAEDALRQSEEQLRQAQKMEAVGRLAGGVAHDFNNLLTVIMGRSRLLLDRMETDNPLRRHVELISRTADRAAALTRQLLAFSRKQVLQPKVLNLAAVVRGMEKMLRRLIGEHIELSFEPGGALGRVKADPVQLEQVVLNLAVNARDAMPRGGRLTIETANVELGEGEVGTAVARPGPYVMLVVSDDGVGMDAETRAHVFEPFFTTKRPGQGTGLGLATVYGIVRQSGGHAAVESEPGRGTTFRIYLPRVSETEESLEPAAVLADTPRGSETVLLVEDEEGLRDLAREILQMHGYGVLEAQHGADAIWICDSYVEPIHLLVTDVVMPHMSGPELADRVTRKRPEIKVLYMSGYTDDATVHHGLSTADMAFLQKPFTADALTRKVREVLDSRRPG